VTVLLFPGAGSDSSHPSLVAAADAPAPVAAVRADFPYREQGRKAPHRAPALPGGAAEGFIKGLYLLKGGGKGKG